MLSLSTLSFRVYHNFQKLGSTLVRNPNRETMLCTICDVAECRSAILIIYKQQQQQQQQQQHAAAYSIQYTTQVCMQYAYLYTYKYACNIAYLYTYKYACNMHTQGYTWCNSIRSFPPPPIFENNFPTHMNAVVKNSKMWHFKAFDPVFGSFFSTPLFHIAPLFFPPAAIPSRPWYFA